MLRWLALCGAALAIVTGRPVRAYGQQTPQPLGQTFGSSASLLRVFLDCNQCDADYVMREVGFVDYVRDRAVADLHVLVTTQGTGGGGTAWTVAFIGQDRFQGQDRTLTFNTTQIATEDDRRKEFARVFRIGLAGYAATTSIAPQLDVTWRKPAQAAQTTPARDPWHYWVFRANGGTNVSGEESSNSRSYRFSFSGNRTTDSLKVSINTNANYNNNSYDIDDTTTIKSSTESWNVNGLMAKSLTGKWSAGFRSAMSHSSFSNNKRQITATPGIEYDFFPYSESSRRSFTIQYSAGAVFYTYQELTVFDKLSETVPRHGVNASLGLRQPWGSINGSANVSQHLNHLDRTRFSVNGDADVRLFNGFSVNFFGNYDRIRDQISLRKGSASTTDVLLRLQQLATGYSYFFSVGVSYRFGSIFNNVVNPRFDRSPF